MTQLSYQNVATMPVLVHGRRQLAFIHVAVKGDAVERVFEVDEEIVFQYSLPLSGQEPKEALDCAVRNTKMSARIVRESGDCIDLEAVIAATFDVVIPGHDATGDVRNGRVKG